MFGEFLSQFYNLNLASFCLKAYFSKTTFLAVNYFEQRKLKTNWISMKKHRGEFKLLQNNIFIHTSKTHCDDLFPVLYYLFPCSSMHTSSSLQPNSMKCKRGIQTCSLLPGSDTVAPGSSKKRMDTGCIMCMERKAKSGAPFLKLQGMGLTWEQWSLFSKCLLM